MDSRATRWVGAPSADNYICRPFMSSADDPRQQGLHGVGGPLPTAKAFGRGGARRFAVKQARLHDRSPTVGRRRSSTQVRPTICEPADSTPPAPVLSLPARNRTGTQLEPRTLHPPPPRHHRGGETHVAETHPVGPQPVGGLLQQGDPPGAGRGPAEPGGLDAQYGPHPGCGPHQSRAHVPPPPRRTADPAAA